MTTVSTNTSSKQRTQNLQLNSPDLLQSIRQRWDQPEHPSFQSLKQHKFRNLQAR